MAWLYERRVRLSSGDPGSTPRASAASGVAPTAVEGSHFEELKRYYSEDHIADIMAVIALFSFLNRWDDNIRTDIEGIHATEKHTRNDSLHLQEAGTDGRGARSATCKPITNGSN